MAFTERYVSVAGGGDSSGDSEANAMTLAEMVTDINAGGKAGYRYNVIKGNYSSASAITITGDGTQGEWIWIRGYNIAIGDLDVPTYNSNGSFDTTDWPNLALSGSTSNLYLNNAANVSVSRLFVHSSTYTQANRGLVYFTATGAPLDGLRVDLSGTGSTTTSGIRGNQGQQTVRNCQVNVTATNASHAIYLSSSDSRVLKNRIRTTGSCDGIYLNSDGSFATLNNLQGDETAGTMGVECNAGNTLSIIHNTISRYHTLIDLTTGTVHDLVIIDGNLLTDATVGIAPLVTTGSDMFLADNRFDRVTTNVSNPTNTIEINSETTSVTEAQEYTAADAGDTRVVVSTSPAVEHAHSSIGMMNAGADQDNDSGGGGAGDIIIPHRKIIR